MTLTVRGVSNKHCLLTFFIIIDIEAMPINFRNKKIHDLTIWGEKKQGFSYLSEVGTRGLLNLGKKHLDHQNWETLMQSKRSRLPFSMD